MSDIECVAGVGGGGGGVEKVTFVDKYAKRRIVFCMFFKQLRLPIHRRKFVLTVFNTYRKVNGYMATMVVHYIILFCRCLFVGPSTVELSNNNNVVCNLIYWHQYKLFMKFWGTWL